MHTRYRIAGLLLSTLMLCSGIAAAAPAKAIAPLRGTIDQVSDTDLQISNRQGEKVDIKLNDKTQIFSVTKGSIDDIKPDSFIGTAAIPQADGSLKALEVHVFAELAALVQELGIQDAATGVKVVSESEVGSEFDLAVLYNNQLYLAECKARAPAGKANGIGMETLFKIDSLVDHNYLNADGLIVSLSAPTHVERSRAALQDIDIISAADLHQLRSRLKTWLQG